MCIVTDLVRNSRLRVTVRMEEDTNMDKSDVPNVKCSSNGRDCGVHVVEDY